MYLKCGSIDLLQGLCVVIGNTTLGGKVAGGNGRPRPKKGQQSRERRIEGEEKRKEKPTERETRNANRFFSFFVSNRPAPAPKRNL